VALTAVAFVAAAFVMGVFAAVGDPYNEPVYQRSAEYADQLVGQIQLRPARAINIGVIDGVGVRGTRRAIREYKRAHGVPGHAQISQQLWA